MYGDRHPGKIRTAEILCVGTELLLGDIVNTDAAFLSRRLAELGIAVYRQSVVGDSPERLRMALTEAFAGHGGAPADLVILSGGIVADDLAELLVCQRLILFFELVDAVDERHGRRAGDAAERRGERHVPAAAFDDAAEQGAESHKEKEPAEHEGARFQLSERRLRGMSVLCVSGPGGHAAIRSAGGFFPGLGRGLFSALSPVPHAG